QHHCQQGQCPGQPARRSRPSRSRPAAQPARGTGAVPRSAVAVPAPRPGRQRPRGRGSLVRHRRGHRPAPPRHRLQWFHSAQGIELMTLMLLGSVLATTIAGIAGGALGGVKIAGAHIGNELAAMMGALYGGTVALPAAIVAALILWLVPIA